MARPFHAYGRARLLACWAAFGAASACQHAHPARARYTAVIEKIEDRMGDHYLPTRGRTPITEVRMRTVSKGVILVFIPGIYSEASYGDVGDWVAFEGPGSVPISGHFWFEQLRGYVVAAEKRETRHQGR